MFLEIDRVGGPKNHNLKSISAKKLNLFTPTSFLRTPSYMPHPIIFYSGIIIFPFLSAFPRQQRPPSVVAFARASWLR
jgi:hypothetical protein